jgi:photosystem II stability/assembly factor-like uncharacterized protein
MKPSSSSPSIRRWKPLGFSGGGGTECAVFSPHDPNRIIINCDMSGAYHSENSGQSWTMFPWQELLGCPFCTPVWHPQDPNRIYAAYGYPSTLRLSQDGGQTFQPIGQGLPGDLRHLCIDGTQPDRMLASTETALYRSDDAGKNWSPCGRTIAPIRGLHFDVNSPAAQRACFVCTAEAVFRSTNAGRTWVSCGNGLPLKRIQAFAAASDTVSGQSALYIWVDERGPNSLSTGEIYRSLDGGNQWLKTCDGPILPPAEYIDAPRTLLVTPVKPLTLYAISPVLDAEHAVYRSEDGGQTWRSLFHGNKTDPAYNVADNHISLYFTQKQGWSITVAAICSSDPNRVLVSDYCTQYLTCDGGKNWKNLDVVYAPGQGKPVHGSRWMNNGLNITTTWNYDIDPFDRARHFISATDIGLCRSIDHGQSWIWCRETAANTFQLAFDPEVPGKMWAGFSEVHDIPNNNIVTGGHRCQGYGTVGYSEDHGATWVDRTVGMQINDELWYGKGKSFDRTRPGCLPSAPVVSVIVDPRSPRDARRLYASSFENGVYRSDDAGLTWNPVGEGLGVTGVNVRVCRVLLHADGTLFCVVTGKMRDKWLMPEGVGLYRLSPKQTRWEKITGRLDVRWFTDFTVDPADSRTIYLAACDDPSRGLAEGGLYRTQDGGHTWKKLARKSALHFSAIIAPHQPNRIYMTLTYNEGLAAPLWMSEDRGETWQPFNDYPFCSAHRVHFDPSEPDAIYVTGYGGGAWKGPAVP